MLARPGFTTALLILLSACGTPEIAREYETKTYVPAELEKALKSEDPARRADAAEQILAMKPAQRKAVLLELTRNPRVEVRLMAVGLLGRHHATDPDVVKAMGEEAALDVDIDVRSAALSALAASGRSEALTAILAALTNDPSLVVRREAGVILDRLTGLKLATEFAGRLEEAEDAADDAAMSYDDWLESNREKLAWDAENRRFVLREGEAQ